MSDQPRTQWFPLCLLPAVKRLAFALPTALLIALPAFGQNIWVVDIDGHASAASCDDATSASTSIQAAVTAASPGDTILICPGTYAEQVAITKSNLTILGSGAGVTVIRPSSVLQNSASVVLPSAVSAIVLVDTAASVTIERITVDGSLADSGAVLLPDCTVLPFYVGIFFRMASGTIDTAHVTGIKSATACADAVRAEKGDVTVTASLVDQYGRAGLSCAGLDATCTIVGNTIRGLGPVQNQTQTGVQIRTQAAGVIFDNVISDHFLLGAHGVPQFSVGIFLVYAQPSSNPHLLQQNIFVNNQINVQRVSSAAAF